MRDLVNWISSEDVYYIVVPIIVGILGVMGNSTMSFFVHEKQWKLLKERSSADRYFFHFIKSIFVGVASYLFAIIFVLFLNLGFAIDINPNMVRMVCIVCCIAFYILLMMIKNVDDGIIVFKKAYRKEIMIRNIIFKIPYFYSLLLWICILCGGQMTVMRIFVVIQIVYEIVIAVMLEGNAKFVYKYADFYLSNGEKIADICVENIKCERSWIIATNLESNIQYRFRVKDLARVEYRE